MSPTEPAKSTLRVARTSERDIKMRGLEVLLDGKHLADLQFGKERVFEIEPGEHVLKITNTVYSKEDAFTVPAGREASYEVANVVTGIGAAMMSVFGIGPYRVDLRKLN